MSLNRIARSRVPAKLTAFSVADTYISTPPILGHSRIAAHARALLPFRPGLLAFKRGMVPWFDESGKMFPCTVLEVDRLQVTNVLEDPNNGFYAVQLGLGATKYSRVTRQMLGHFARAKVSPKQVVAEFQVKNSDGLIPLGTELSVDHFIEGQFVDMQSTTRGKGFAGVMKRWGFHGQPASHGNSLSHRAAGSTGQHQDPGRVTPGKKMAGNMGNKNHTIQNARIIKVYPEKNIILVKGPVSGSKGRMVKIWDAKKKPWPEELKIKWKQFKENLRL